MMEAGEPLPWDAQGMERHQTRRRERARAHQRRELELGEQRREWG